jgi:DtxR family Mn-dependent transcriptional regulator
MEKLNINNQDILETIYELEKNKGKARLTDIALKLGFSKSRTNQEIKKLISMGLIHEDKYGPIVLTKLGLFEAERIMFTHLLIKTFLKNHLGLDEETSERDACAIEHIISEETIKAMVKHLEKDLDNIGDFNLTEAEEYLVKKKRLSELKVGQKAQILKIEGLRSIKKRIMEFGIIKGEIIELIGVAPFGDPLSYRLNDFNLSLRIKEADNVIVELIEEV